MIVQLYGEIAIVWVFGFGGSESAVFRMVFEIFVFVHVDKTGKRTNFGTLYEVCVTILKK